MQIFGLIGVLDFFEIFCKSVPRLIAGFCIFDIIFMEQTIQFVVKAANGLLPGFQIPELLAATPAKSKRVFEN